MNENLEKYYNYLKGAQADVPDTFDSFQKTLSDETTAKQYYDYLKSSGFDAPDTFDSFSRTFELKKKSPTSLYLESLAKGTAESQTPATRALRDYWTEQENLPKVQPPLRLGEKPAVSKQDIFATEQDISSVLKARNKLPDYLKSESDRIVSETYKNLEDELASLDEKYKTKKEATPEKAKELEKERVEQANKIIDLKSEGLQKGIENLYSKGKQYEYLDPADVKTLSEQIKEVASQPIDYVQKEDRLKTIEKNFMSQMEGATAEEKVNIQREISDIIAQNALFDEKGNPTVYGWKREVKNKSDILQHTRDRMLKEHPELANIVTDYKVRTSDIGKQFQVMTRAYDLYTRIRKLPDDGGSFWEGFKSQGRQMASLGMADLFESLDVKKVLDKQRKGDTLSMEEQSLVDAYGIYQATQGAEELSKAYSRGAGLGASVAWMGQFALTSPLGTAGEKTAIKLLGQNIKNKVVQNIAKGLGSAVVRAPLLTGGYTEAIKRMTGSPQLTKEGQWKVNKATVEPVIEAVGKGLYSNLANAFGETAGGWFAGSKFNKIIGGKLGLTRIPKNIASLFNTIGMQPLGELGEEYLTTLMETPVMGDQTLKEAFSGENLWETAVQVGIMSGFFGGLAAPAVVSENIRRGRAMDMIKIFGKDNVSALRTAIENNDKEAFADVIRKSFEGKTEEDLGMSLEKAQKELIKYSNYLAQVKGHDVAQEAVKEAVKEETGVETPQKTIKTEEETKDAEGTGTPITGTGEQAQGVVEGEEAISVELSKEKSSKKEEGFAYDVNWYEIKDNNGNVLGNIVLQDKGNYYQVQNAKVETPRKGIGYRAYKNLIEKLDKPLYSDTSITQPAHALWNKLVKEGLAEQFKENIGSENKPNIISRYRTTNSFKRNAEENGLEAVKGEEVSEIVVAPFYNTQVKSPEDADVLRQSPEYKQHVQNINDKATALGLEVTDLSENIGHYTNDAGEKITELSNSITIKGTYEQAQQLAAVLGATTPEVQETTIAGHYVKAGDTNHESDEVNIEVTDFKGALAVLDELGIDYTLNQSTNTFKFLDFSKGEDLDFKNNIITFANRLKEKGIRYGKEDRRPTQSRLINAEDRRGILGRLNEEAVQRGQGGTVLRGITEEATKRNEEFLRPREKVTQGGVSATTTEAVTGEGGITTPPEQTPPVVTPPIEPPAKEPKKEKPSKEREKTLLNRFLNAQKLSNKFKEHLKKKGTTYTVIPNDITSEEADYILASNGLDQSEKIIEDTKNDLKPRIRGLMGIRLVNMLDQLALDAQNNKDPKAEADYRLRAVDLADWLDETARDWGRGIQIFASTEVTSALTPKSQVIKAKRMLRKQRDKQIAKNKSDIDSKNSNLQDANKESVDEVLSSDEYKALKKKIADLEKQIAEGTKERPERKLPSDKIKAERVKRQGYWRDFNTHGKEALSTTVLGLNAKQIEDISKIIASYVKEGVYRTEDLIKKLQKDWLKNVEKPLSYDDAKALLPKEVDGKSLKDIEEEGVVRKSAEQLAKRVDRMLKDPTIPKDDPIKQMIDTLFEKIKEKDTAEKIKPEGKTPIDKIRDALIRRKLYSDVWEEAKEIVSINIGSNEELTEEEKSDLNKRLSDFYNEIIGTPFSEMQAEKATRKAIKDLDINIDKIVRDHYTVYDATKRTLQEKLVEELGLEEEESKLLADAVAKQFDKIAVAKKRAILQKGITPKEIVNPKKAKATWEKLIELTNLGAFSDSEFTEAYADAWGFPKLTPDEVKELERLATKVYEAPEGSQKYERTQDLLAYQAKLQGVDLGDVALGMWYASILSGFRTQFKNVFANSINSFFEWAVASIKHPTRIWRLAEALATGWVKGGYAFTHILRSGYNPIRGFKIEVPQALELKQFKGGNWNPANWFKYVPRFMVAADAFSYAGLKEMRAYELAMNQARAERKEVDAPPMSMVARANEILGRTPEKIKEAKAQTIQEGFKEGSNDYWRRVWEIMEQERGQTIIEDSAHFAAHGTFNYPPEGLIGFATEFISEFTQWTPLRFNIAGRQVTIKPTKLIIPFTRIIANVANVALDYFPPVAAVRAGTGRVGLGLDQMRFSKHAHRKYTPDERKSVAVKMMIGALAEAALFALSEPPDDGEEPMIEITANGTGDYKKNNELLEKGWQKYSIRIGKKWYSYQYTPLVLALAPLGFFRDEQKYNKDRISEDKMLQLVGMSYFKAFSVMGDMTWVTQLTGLLDAISATSLSDVENYFQRMKQTTVKGIIYPKMIEQTVQLIDYVQKNPRRESLSTWGKIMKDIPIVRDEYYTMLNAAGEPVLFDPFQMVSSVESDPYWDYLARHNIFIGKPQKKVSFYDGEKEIERTFTDEEYYNYVLTSGQEIKRRIMEEVVPKEFTEEQIKRETDNIKNEVRQKTKVEMFGWGEFRMSNPDKWKMLKENNAIQVPVTSPIEWMTDEGKTLATPEEMSKYNKKAMNYYSQYMDEYLKSDAPNDKKEINETTGETWFYTTVKSLWQMAREDAKYEIIEERQNK